MNTGVLEKVDQYVLQYTIGSGSFGKVKCACHEPTGCSVAIKIINKEKLEKSDNSKKIIREVNNLKKFRHPHIIKLYDVIETRDDIYLVMELVGGGELFDYIVQAGRLSENEGRHYFQQMISAVGYCHKKKVAHRDLKPENLLMSIEKDSLKIADFGLSNVMKDGELLKTSCGSPNYAAPEVVDGRYYSGEEIDVWSCGVILYAIVTARLPFDDNYIPHLFNKIKRGKFKMPSYLSDTCKDLISQMLNIDPLKRITIPEIRYHPWFLENLPTTLAEYLDGYDLEYDKILDDTILNEMEDIYNMRKSQLRDHILIGESEGKMNQYIVSYRLLYDRFQGEGVRVVPTKRKHSGSDDSIARSVAELSMSPPLNLRDEVPFIYSDSQINVLDALKAQDLKNAKKSFTEYPLNHVHKKKLWYLGIMSKRQPDEVMNEVFRVLKKFNFEWKVIHPYQIQARPLKTSAEINSYYEHDILLEHSYESEQNVKLSLQLFKIKPKKGLNEMMYLLDIKNVEGHPITFFDQCSLLIEELKV